MAQHSLKWPAAPLRERQLGVDKAFVILGFIAGLPLGLGVVGAALTAVGAPEWLNVVGLAATVATTTAVGSRLGDWAARHLRAAA
ncbi:MAG: hypothetical protein RI907_1414 [Pseudomonadota bacterium]